MLPIAAAATIGTGLVVGRLDGEAGEAFTRRVSLAGAASAGILLAIVILLRARATLPPQLTLGTWMASGRYRIDCSLTLDALSLSFAALVLILGGAVLRFSAQYMHREPGYHRFFFVVSLFIGAMVLLALSGNGLVAFAGWEAAGVCSLLLIAYAHERPVPARNATRAFITNRVGDVGFLLGLLLSIAWIGDVEWPKLAHAAPKLQPIAATLLALCFLVAAAAKSAQFPFTPWATRAMEGPTPSSALFYGAVMIHAGAYLLLRLEPVFEQSAPAMICLVLVGATTALYAYLTGLTQSDVKSSLVLATVAQVGLIFLACGLGWWTLATVHLFSHAVVRGFQFLSAPSLMHRVGARPTRPVPAFLARHAGLYQASLHGFWLEATTDRLFVCPVQHTAADAERFERQVVDRIVGLPVPALGSLSSAAVWEEARLAATGGSGPDAREAGGLLRWMAHQLAAALHWFEEKLVLQGVGADLWKGFRRFGQRLRAV
ncbi:MAG: hypothetical protein FJ189_12735, partial [Gammaproteobacteria bacterium]|nr:hypothetical protein [Gammaproteobacteria bacterium]